MSVTPRPKSKTVIMNSIQDNGTDEDHIMNHVLEIQKCTTRHVAQNLQYTVK